MIIINHQLSTINRHPRAFTLLELLVAMLLMVVVSACLYTSLYTGFRARRSAAAAIEPTTKAMNAIALIKHDILGTLQPNDGLAGDFLGVDAQGDSGAAQDSLSLYTTHSQPQAGAPAGGIGLIELLLTEDSNIESDTAVLVRSVTTNLLASSTGVPEDQVLCRGIRSFNLRYHDGSEWLDEWDSTLDEGLPLAVEIDLEVEYTTEGVNRQTLGRHLVQSFPLPCGGVVEAEGEGQGQGKEAPPS